MILRRRRRQRSESQSAHLLGQIPQEQEAIHLQRRYGHPSRPTHGCDNHARCFVRCSSQSGTRPHSSDEADRSADHDAECPNKVAIANLVSTYTAEDVFKFDQTCSLNDNKTAAHCTGSIEVLADKKPALSVYPSVSVTLVFTVTYDTAATQVGHTEPNAYTFTVPREGKADFEFDTAYDEKWGSYYKLYPNAFYPDE